MIEKKENLQVTCDIIQDLLPLYHDGVVHENTGEIIKKHLEQCATCRKEYADLCKEIPLEIAEPSTKERFIKMLHIQKRKRFTVTVLTSILVAALLLGVFSFCTLFGFTLSSKEVQLETKIQYSEEAYLNQMFGLDIQRLDSLPLWVSSKSIFDDSGVLIGYEFTPKKHLFNLVPNSDEYTTGYYYANDGSVPNENFDFTITVKFSDQTVIYSMTEEGLFIPHDLAR